MYDLCTSDTLCDDFSFTLLSALLATLSFASLRSLVRYVCVRILIAVTITPPLFFIYAARLSLRLIVDCNKREFKSSLIYILKYDPTRRCSETKHTQMTSKRLSVDEYDRTSVSITFLDART